MKEKKRGGKGLFKIIAIIIAIVAIGGTAFTFAMIDETNSVHIDASEIEDSTLIIGSHLIYLGAMTDQVYEIAMESAQQSNQYNRYYKSELAGGTWYNVTEAGSLADITTGGIVVDDKEIEALFMTHHTKSDGITYDLRTGKSLSVFDINDPYNLEDMPELEPIKLQYDVLVQTEDPSETMERDMLYIEEVYKKNRKTEVTDKIDEEIDYLQTYYEILVRDGADSSMSDMVMTVMEKLDAARRVEVFTPLVETELQTMSTVVSREFVYVEGEVTGAAKAEDESEKDRLDNFVINTNLVTAIGEAMTNVQESYISYSAKMLAEGTTVLSKAEYDITKEFIEQAKGQNYSLCDESVMKLIYINRISEGVIREEDAERSFIESDLIRQADRAYTESISAGEGEAYKSLSSMAAAATKANVLKTQKNETEIVRNELQFIIQAYTDRMPTEEAMEYIAERIDGVEALKSSIKNDAYKEYAASSVDAYYDWLMSTLNSLQDSLGNRTMDGLNEQKDDLQTERMSALDKNNLALAKQLEAKIEAIDKEIEDLEKQLNDIINSSNTSASEKAKAASQLGSGNASAAVRDMKNSAIEDLRNGNYEGIENIIDGIGAVSAVNPESALGALKDIYEELSNQELMGADSSAIKNLLDKVEDVTAENMSNFTGDISEDDLARLIASFVDENMGGLSDIFGMLSSMSLSDVMKLLKTDQMAIVLAGLNMYAEQTGSSNIGKLVAYYSRFALDDANYYLFDWYTQDPVADYIPTDRVAKVAGYRYIFNDSQKAVTLQKGSQYYKFEAFSIEASKGTDTEEMERPAGFMSVIYIPAETAEKYFAISTERVLDSEIGVLLTESMREDAISFFDYLLQAGGDF